MNILNTAVGPADGFNPCQKNGYFSIVIVLWNILFQKTHIRNYSFLIFLLTKNILINI